MSHVSSNQPNQRISTFRKELKELAQNAVLAHYALTPGECGPKVDWLLSELIYIYPKLDYEVCIGRE